MCSASTILANSCYLNNWGLIIQALSISLTIAIFVGGVVGFLSSIFKK